MNREKFMPIIRIVAGAYLAYLAYGLLGGNDLYNEGEPVPLYGKIAAVAFIAIGIYFVVDGIRKLYALYKKDKEEPMTGKKDTDLSGTTFGGEENSCPHGESIDDEADEESEDKDI